MKTRVQTTFSLNDGILHATITKQSVDEYGRVLTSSVKQKDYLLNEVTEEELLSLRKSRKPGFVLKDGDTYLFSEIPKYFSFMSFRDMGEHLCGSSRYGCSRLKACEDCDGGCAKVRDLVTEAYTAVQMKSFNDAIEASKRIEKYPFITKGYESFNTSHDCMTVLSCQQFEEDIKRDQFIIQ